MDIRRDIPIEEFPIKIEPPIDLPLRLRLPASVAEHLKAEAAAEGRTVSDHVAHLLLSTLSDA